MQETSLSLLHRVRGDPNSPDWEKLFGIYVPLIRGWLRGHTILADDADDVVQEVLAVVIRRLPEFEHNQRTGAFRAWLRAITVNCLREHWKAKKRRPSPVVDSQFRQLLAQLEEPTSPLSQLWDEEHDRHVMRKLLASLRPAFERTTWRAFEKTALDGGSAAEVAAELGITQNAVFIAKSRVLARLRQEAAGLLD